MDGPRLARHSAIALGLALVPVAVGALIRTAKHLSWRGLDWLTISLTLFACAFAMGAELSLAHQNRRARITRTLKNILFSVFVFLGLILALSAYRTLAGTVTAVDYKTIAMVAVVGGAIMGVAMSWMEKAPEERKDNAAG